MGSTTQVPSSSAGESRVCDCERERERECERSVREGDEED